MPEFTLIQQICIWAIPVLLAITLHEAAHGYVAYKCGDTTAKIMGRLSLNPIRHIDLIGTIIMPLVIGVLTQFNFIFGYAKPVPVNARNLRNPRRDMVLVALAGPVSNFIMAFMWAGCLKLSTLMHPESSMFALFLLAAGRAGMIINILLGVLNLIPLPPLDGSKVLAMALPYNQARLYLQIEPYGFLILILLMYTGVLGYILTPLMHYCVVFLAMIFQL